MVRPYPRHYSTHRVFMPMPQTAFMSDQAFYLNSLKCVQHVALFQYIMCCTHADAAVTSAPSSVLITANYL